MGIASDLHIYFTLAGAMLLMLGIQNWRIFLVLFALSLGALLFVMNFAPVGWFHRCRRRRRCVSYCRRHAMINTIIINAAMIFYALAALRRAEVELQTQYERSEALIAAVMPQPIAER